MVSDGGQITVTEPLSDAHRDERSGVIAPVTVTAPAPFAALTPAPLNVASGSFRSGGTRLP